MNLRISRTILIGLGFAGMAIAILVFTMLRESGAGGAGADATISGLETRRSGDYQRPAPPETSGDSTDIEFASAAAKTPAEVQLENLDPAQDGWDTELLASSAARALTQIFDPGADPAGWPLSDGFKSTPLRPQSMVEVYHVGNIRVRRADPIANPDDAHTVDRRSLENELPSGESESKRKIIRITKSPGGFSTRVIALAHGSADQTRQQTTSVWDCDWESPAGTGDLSPRLLRLTVRSHEEVSWSGPRPLFEDFAGAVLPEEIGPHDSPITHWARTLTKIDDMHFLGHHGIALGDADGDGLDDLYVCDAGGLPNRLYLQNPDGTARDVSAEAGVDWLESSQSALFVDLDNDGDQDLVVATVALLLLLENDGEANFSVRGGIPGLSNPQSLSAADFDGDGRLDLFVCNYGTGSAAGGGHRSNSGPPLPFNDALNGGRNALLKNDGKMRFSDVTAESGIAAAGDRWSFAASWEDYDNDGDQDLYVANDFGRNNLFRNEGERFTDVAASAGVEDISSGMSVAWGDANRDGKMDLYVSNMFSSAGGRIAFQRQFGKSTAPDAADFQRMARGNTLFIAGDNDKFSDASESAGVNVGLWAWGSQFADLNNDGWQDLVVTNGYLSNESGGPDL